MKFKPSSLLLAPLISSLLIACSTDSTNENTASVQGNVQLPVIAGSNIASATMTSTIPEAFKFDGVTTYVNITPGASSVSSRSANLNSNVPAIHVIATDDGVNGEKVRRAVMILQHLLTDLDASLYGEDKLSIATSMANRNATLILTADNDASEQMNLNMYITEAYRQGQLQTWVAASGATTLEGLDFSSTEQFVQSFLTYSDNQSEDDVEAVIGSLAEGLQNSAQTPKWLINSQSLMYRELSVEGDCHYMSGYANYCSDLGDNADRDAAFEEILHLVQAQGIAPNPETEYSNLQLAIDAHALSTYNDHKSNLDAHQPSNAVWQPEVDDWNEWLGDDVNPDIGTTYSHEYLAAAFEAYMGVAKHNGRGLDGYQALDRTAMQALDPQGKAWISGLFHEHLQYTARIDSAGVVTFHQQELVGQNPNPTFKMNLVDAHALESYTSKSQWLVNAKIIGTDSIDLIANDQNNILEGNSANNTIDGKGGDDTYIVNNKFAECAILPLIASTTLICPSSGEDDLINIEAIKFTDQTYSLTP